MDPARFQRVQELFLTLADLPAQERRRKLDLECAADSELRAAVQALLDADNAHSPLLDQPLASVAASVLTSPDLPRRIGPYEIHEPVGEGGMGVVYRATHTGLGTQAAIKILRDAWLSPARRERFAREQHTLAQLDHPAIARIFDADTLPDGTPWFAMELVHGLPLTEYCQRHATNLHHRLSLLRSVAEAVQFAHAHAIIHRDLKPSNILVRPGGQVCLLDFGIAAHIDESGLSIDHTRTGLRLMTPAYAAPEQVRGLRTGAYTDVYALGALLHELLTGQPPFDLASRTPGEASDLIAQSEPPRPSRRARDLGLASAASAAAWRDLDLLTLKAMHKDPARRYSTAEAFARDLDRFLRLQPLEASPDRWSYRAGMFARRHARALSAAALISVAAIAFAGFFTFRLAAARSQAREEAARTERIQRFMLDLFHGGDPDSGPPGALRVVQLLDRGARQARSLDAEPRIQAELFLTLGSLYLKQGGLDQASELLNLARTRREALDGPSHPETARVLLALAELLAAQARFDAAESLIRQARSIQTLALPPSHPAHARALSALGKVLSDRGRYAEAIRVLESASRAAAPADAPGILFELANAEFYAGHYPRAEELNRRALPLFRQSLGEGHPTVADVLINLGAVRAEQGDPAGAAQRYREALRITEAWFGPDHPKTASQLTMLGRVLVRLQQSAEAMALLRRAIAIQERHFGINHPRVASALNEIGTLSRSLGRIDDADAAYRRAARIWREAHGPEHYLNGIASSNLASIALDRGRLADAESHMRAALAVFIAATGPTHSNSGIARLKLGRVLLRAGKFADAERELRAGLAILEPQMQPDSPWLEAARKDLAALPAARR